MKKFFLMKLSQVINSDKPWLEASEQNPPPNIEQPDIKAKIAETLLSKHLKTDLSQLRWVEMRSLVKWIEPSWEKYLRPTTQGGRIKAKESGLSSIPLSQAMVKENSINLIFIFDCVE